MKEVNKVTSRESLRVGIVGCGEIASLHLSSISKIPDAKLTAVCDKNETLAKRMSDRAKINRYYTDISKMLGEERLDVIHITTPPQTHFALTAQSIEADCHVLVEKPMALNLDETDKLIELARNPLFLDIILPSTLPERIASFISLCLWALLSAASSVSPR